MGIFTDYIVTFLILLTVLVYVHEMGHFLLARLCGVRVEVFSIGFGPELFGFTDRAGTRWKISALPLGGYVKMFGHTEVVTEADGAERIMTPAERAVSFVHKPLLHRTAIVAAGPAANFLFAVVALAILFAVYGQPVSSTVVGEVVSGSAAAAAGIEPGDRIVSLNGAPVRRFEDIASIVQLGLGEPLEVVVEREGQRLTLYARPTIIEQTDNFGYTHRIGRLGIQSTGAGEVVRYGPVGAVSVAAQETWRMTASTLKAVWQMIAGSRPSDELGGIISIAKMSGDVARTGFVALIGFAVLLSINLGLINLFPIPMLDGGHLAFFAVEAVRGRPLGARAQEWGFRIGLALVVALFVFATHNDLSKLGVVRFIRDLMT